MKYEKKKKENPYAPVPLKVYQGLGEEWKNVHKRPPDKIFSRSKKYTLVSVNNDFSRVQTLNATPCWRRDSHRIKQAACSIPPRSNRELQNNT